MSVLVTGGAGYIGSHITYGLLDAAEDVVVLDDLPTGFRWVLPEEASFDQGCVGDAELVHKILRKHSVDAVIHCAGSVVVPEFIAQPLRYYHNNTCNARSLITCLVEQTGSAAHHLFVDGGSLWALQVNPVGETAEPRHRSRPTAPRSSWSN